MSASVQSHPLLQMESKAFLRIRRGLKNLISTAGPDGACLAGDMLRGSPGGNVNLKLKFCAEAPEL